MYLMGSNPETEELVWHFALSPPIARHDVRFNDRDNVLSLVTNGKSKDE
jgi:hypothetical protein